MARLRKRAGDAERERWVITVGEIGGGPGVKRSARHEQQINAMLHAAHSSAACAQTRRWARVQGSELEGAVKAVVARLMILVLSSEGRGKLSKQHESDARSP